MRCPPIAANEPPDRPLAGSRQTGSRTAKGGARPVRAGCAARSRSPRMRGTPRRRPQRPPLAITALAGARSRNGCLGRRGLVIADGTNADRAMQRHGQGPPRSAVPSRAQRDRSTPVCPRVSAVTSYPLGDPASRTIPRSLDSLRAGLAVVVTPGCLPPQ